VTRFDYVPARFEPLRAAFGAGRRPAGIRLAAGVVGASLIFVTAMWSFEEHRLTQLADELNALQTQARFARIAMHRARRLRTTLLRLRDIDTTIALARQEAIATTNVVSRIGNSLPSGTWLTGVQAATTGGWTIAGRSKQIADVGATLGAIEHLDGGAATHLVSVAATGRASRILDFVIDCDLER
jgi:hypothetical protein